MKRLIIKENYKSILNLMETEIAIKFVKDTFERKLARALNLTRVSAPLFVFPSTGLNDNLNGHERRVSFDINGVAEEVEIVQSLAKWKRSALAKYGFEAGTGLYTDMNAIRRDEDLDTLHSAYVDQWDWEKIITKDLRSVSYLKKVVTKIYKVLRNVEKAVHKKFSALTPILPKDVFFITTQELEDMYPDKTGKEREYAICKEHKAVFLIGIGNKLKSGVPHDGRAADYDDWQLIGDLLLYYEELDIEFEISSMGIRVDEESILSQLKQKGEEYKINNEYVQGILNKKLPYTIGGGIGQSRLCMFFLKKAHIGEVQASVWEEKDIKYLESNNIHLL
ncbi:MAG: aspartate--ammonia ligase [Acholeplasmatales bacterium]|nr:aspartate--ammonia ligase [Acholeplasmatales bacterium]